MIEYLRKKGGAFIIKIFLQETKATIVKLESRIIELLNQLQTLNEEKLNQESSLEELFKTHDELSNQYDFECKERERKEKEVAHLEQQLQQLQEKQGKETVSGFMVLLFTNLSSDCL